MVTVLRNNQSFGPYSMDVLKIYIEEGKILLSDRAIELGQTRPSTVRQIIKGNKTKLQIRHKGGFIGQIRSLGKELIFPRLDFIQYDLFKDKKLIYLAAIGLAPAFLIRFTFSSYLTFYCIALYFSVLWAYFFYYLFKTHQVVTKKVISVFFLSQLSAFVFINLQSIPPFSILYSFINSNIFILKYTGFVLGVGVLEEVIKAIPLYYIIRKSDEPLIPQTIVFYGLMSGIGFGVFEGVLYQTSTNTQLAYNEAFFMNIARLTSLPFLHAVWCGIAGYFISFGHLYPLYRKGFLTLSVLIPAILHGSYDVFGWSLLGLVITVFSVLLLVFYLKKSLDYQFKLINL